MSDIVTREVKIHASAATVFDYFVDPSKLARWHAVAAEVDARPGGTYRLEVIPGSIALGEFVELEPPNRLGYTWGGEGDQLVPPGSSTVEVTLEQDGEYTIVRIAHRGLPDEEQRDKHGMGWAHYLERLAVSAAGADPGPDPWHAGAP